ncbi:MAG: formate dehydrogenase accessory sulfurtransferase FdhD [Armatimonadetes bacterium]|nr:formate dehydrogenase accessory sulfurtransferase FdhD [Armatimonadota bacterium]
MAQYEEFKCRVWDGATWTAVTRRVAVEWPLTIILDGEPLVVLTRTPGDDRDLVLGYLLTEGIISSADDIVRLEFYEGGDKAEVEVRGRAPTAQAGETGDVRARLCGLCGTRAIETLALTLPAIAAPPVTAKDLQMLAELMRAGQKLFAATGATHAVALAPTTPVTADAPVVVREDIGRCNAVDKAIGACYSQGIAIEGPVLMVSGRISLETLAKAARAGIGAVAGVSAPTTAAVRLARRLSMFLAGFVRGESLTLYSGGTYDAAS